MRLTAAWAAVKCSQSSKAGALFVLYLDIMHSGQSSSTEVRAEMDLEESQCPPPPDNEGLSRSLEHLQISSSCKMGCGGDSADG